MTTLMPPGQYIGSVAADRTEAAESSGGNAQVVLTLQLAGGVTRRLYLTYAAGKAEQIATETLTSLGWNGAFGSDAVFKAGTDREFYCQHKPDNKGNMRENWGLSKGAGAGKPLANDKKMLLSAKFRAAAGSVSSIPTTRPPVASKGPPPAAIATKDSAWAAWELKQKGDVDKWRKCLAEIGADESKFGAAEWSKVIAAADIPF